MSKGVHEDGLTNEQRSSMEKVAKQLGVSKENLKQFENTIKEVKKQNADATFDLARDGPLKSASILAKQIGLPGFIVKTLERESLKSDIEKFAKLKEQ
ncbi:unnamed protein product [Dracunculus medinensis]|uniref:DUF4332 domain-containing protein n=1 Tax=Dracunculus medinensis TaxID=318479 RepID=A0A0N4U0X0_DRAME|nr:unnamed protein product [Dracunculus medinensis]